MIGQNLSDFGKKGTLDIAWLEIDPESAAAAGLVGVSLEVINPHHEIDIRNETCAMVGLPAAFHKWMANPVRENVPLDLVPADV